MKAHTIFFAGARPLEPVLGGDMDADTVNRLIRSGEDSSTEFKSLAAAGFAVEAKLLARAVCALANTRGGWLLLGVEDDGTVTGAGTRKQIRSDVGATCSCKTRSK